MTCDWQILTYNLYAGKSLTLDKADLMMIHPSAEISPQAAIGAGTRIWHHVQIREGATIGNDCTIGRDVYIDADVQIGHAVKIQNSALLYKGTVLEDGVFIGPRVCLTNDRYPRAITPWGTPKGVDDWVQGKIQINYGASIGAGAIIVTGVTIGRFAMIAAGAVVTHDVPDQGLVMGVPARLVGYVCACGQPISDRMQPVGYHLTACSNCATLSAAEYLQLRYLAQECR